MPPTTQTYVGRGFPGEQQAVWAKEAGYNYFSQFPGYSSVILEPLLVTQPE